MLLLLRDIAIAIADALTGRSRRRYEHAISIKAPRELVWRMLRASDITFPGYFPLRIVTIPMPENPGHERLRIIGPNAALGMIVRIAEERPGKAIMYELVSEGTDAILLDGHDDFMAFVLDDDGAGTHMLLTRELTITSRLGRVTVPFSLRAGSERYRRFAEQAALEAAGAGDARST